MLLYLHLVSHSAVALLITTLWWGVNQWSAMAAPSLLISGLTIGLSVATAIILSHLVHEWGHFIGALLSRSAYTLKPKISPLFFDFDYVKNVPRQYLCFSAGGPLGNVLLAAATTLLLLAGPHLSNPHLSNQPQGLTTSQQWLLATMLGQLVYVLVLELPVSLGILAGKNPLEVLSTHFGQGAPLFQRSLLAGISSALLVAAALTF